MINLTSHERDILLEVAGFKPASPWSAWVGACLEALRGYGFVGRYRLTERGWVRAVYELGR